MKKIFILSIGALFCLAGCSDDPVGSPKKSAASLSVEKVQRAFVGYVGGILVPTMWFSWGPGFKLIRDEYSTDEVVGMYFVPKWRNCRLCRRRESCSICESVYVKS